MDEESKARIRRILNGIDSSDANLLRETIQYITNDLALPEREEALKAKLRDSAKRIKEIEKKVLKRNKELEDNPICTRCRKRAGHTKHMIHITKWVYLCHDCINECYELVQGIKT